MTTEPTDFLDDFDLPDLDIPQEQDVQPSSTPLVKHEEQAADTIVADLPTADLVEEDELPTPYIYESGDPHAVEQEQAAVEPEDPPGQEEIPVAAEPAVVIEDPPEVELSELSPVVAEQPAAAPTFVVDPQDPAPATQARSRLPLIAGSVAAVLAIAGTAWFFLSPSDPAAQEQTAQSAPVDEPQAPLAQDPVQTQQAALTPADLVDDVMASPEVQLQEEAPEVEEPQPPQASEPPVLAEAKPAPVAKPQPDPTPAKPKPAPVAAKPKPANKPAKEPTPDPAWQDEALNALEAFEKRL